MSKESKGSRSSKKAKAKRSGKESKTAKAVTRSGKGVSRGWAIGGVSVVVALLILGGVWWALQSTITTPVEETTTLSTANFTFTVKDKITGASLNTSSWEIYNTTAVDDWTKYTAMDTGTSTRDEIHRTEINKIISWLDTDYVLDSTVFLYMRATAVNNMSLPRDCESYAERWIRLDVYGANVLDFTLVPYNAVGGLYAQNGTMITTANFTASDSWIVVEETAQYARPMGNFSAFIGMNATDVGYAGYQSQFCPNSNPGAAIAQVYLVFTFNETITSADLTIARQTGGTSTWSQVVINGTAIAFTAGAIVDNCILDFNWKQDSTGIRINHVEIVNATKLGLETATGLTVLKDLV